MSTAKTHKNPPVPPLELIDNSPDSSDEENINANNEQAEIVNRDASPESGIDLASRGTTDFTEATMVSESTERTVIPPNELFNFDLTNPDEVVKMLENVNLTDEDTDVLLQEAYNVNMKLKEILRRQEQSGGRLNPADAAALNGSNVVVVPGPSKKGSVPNSRINSASKKSQFAKTQPLPPINNLSTQSSNMRVPSAVYSASLQRPVPPPSASQTSHKRKAMSSQDRRMGSRNPSAVTHKIPQKSTKKTAPLPTEERPAWNDRFMY